jgi:glycosyltransferase involved in cell wall biosynthesis
MIMPSMLANLLRTEYPDRDVFEYIIEIKMKKWSRIGFIYKFHQLLRTIDKGSRFHYPMNGLPLLHFFRGDHLTMSVTNCCFAPDPYVFRKSGLYLHTVLLFAEIIDVLSPQIYHQTMRHKLLKKKLQLTPGGTFIRDFPTDISKKYPIVAFIGRLEPQKGIIDFLDVVPKIWTMIKNDVPAEFKICIAGVGSLTSYVEKRVVSMKNNDIPIYYNGHVQMKEFIKPVSVTFSIQQLTNYPSRVVGEALLSGSSVIISNTGDSKMFGETLSGLCFCKADLDANELAPLILSTLQKYTDDDYFDVVRQEAKEVFCAKNYVDYFERLFCLNNS